MRRKNKKAITTSVILLIFLVALTTSALAVAMPGSPRFEFRGSLLSLFDSAECICGVARDDNEPDRRPLIVRRETVRQVWVCRFFYYQRENGEPCLINSPCDECCSPGDRCGKCDICIPIALPDGEVIYKGEGIRFEELFEDYIKIFSELEFLSFTYNPILYTGAELCEEDLPFRVGEYTVTATFTSPYEDIGTGYTYATLFISPARIYITGLSIDNKTFDATRDASFDSDVLKLYGIFGNDHVSIGYFGTAEFANAEANENILVIISDFVLDGDDAHNYILVQPEAVYGNILPAPLHLVVELEDKIFSGTPYIQIENVSIVGYFEYFDYIEVEFYEVAQLTSPEIGDNVGVFFDDFVLAGADAQNYRLYQPHQRGRVIGSGLDVIIGDADDDNLCCVCTYEELTHCDCKNCLCLYNEEYEDRVLGYISKSKLPITISIEFANKIYNRDTDVEVLSYELSGLVGGFGNVYVGLASIEQSAELYNFRAASDVDILFDHQLVLLGADAHNYMLVQPEGYALDINPATLSVAGIVPQDRAYNSTRSVAFSEHDNMHLVGFVSNDCIVNIGGAPRLTFANANAGENIPIALAGVVLTGVDASNYIFVPPTDLTGSITPAEGTLPIIGNPWLGESLFHGYGEVSLYGINGNLLNTREFSPDMLGDWSLQWTADGDIIKGANSGTYFVSAHDRTYSGNDIMDAQIGLTLLSACGNFTLRESELTDRVPFNIRLMFNTYPTRRPGDNAVLFSGHANGSGTGVLFRRQISGGIVTIANTLSDGNMNGAGFSRADFMVGERNVGAITDRGAVDINYTVSPTDAEYGVITIRATYTHRGISLIGYNAYFADFGYQTCFETIDWQSVTVRNIGNTDTGEMQLDLTGGNPGAFELLGDVALLNSLYYYGAATTFNIRPNPDNLADNFTADTLLRTNLSIKSTDISLSTEVSVTVMHGAQSAFMAYGATCRTTCTIAGCGRVVRQHASSFTNPAFTGADNTATCTRTRTCQAAGCGRQVVESHARGGSQGGTWAASGANCRRTSPCTVAGCGRANAWVQQHATVQSGWAAGGSGCQRVCNVAGCGRQTATHATVQSGWTAGGSGCRRICNVAGCGRQTATHATNSTWTRGGLHPQGVGGLTAWCEAVCGTCGRATVARGNHIMVFAYLDPSRLGCRRRCTRGCPEMQHISHATGVYSCSNCIGRNPGWAP
ncbi:MAG: YDG domain-containing protein [Oscillospiraceae bacterium]|nr:YDG domain-containing protein [Oscillospiraceae bacterium]MCL2278647.1 YDG domain-containing protein [Oscillospiraceae bacterium]